MLEASFMRWLLIALLVGCGGSGSDNCRQNAVRAFTATRELVSTPACDDLPTRFTASLTVENGTWTFTEADTVPFQAPYVDPVDGCYGYAFKDEPGTYRDYVVWLNGREPSFVNVVRIGSCMARYSLR